MSVRSDRGGIAVILAVAIAVVLMGIGAFVLWSTADTTLTCRTCEPAEAGDLDAVTAALAGIADADERAADASNSLDTALDGLEIEPGAADRRAIVLALLEAGADPNTSVSLAGGGGRTSAYGLTYGGADGGSALHAVERVVRLGDDELLDRFLAAGLDVKGRPGGAALTMAAAEGRLPLVKRLIDLGADVNARHDNLGSPLAAAVYGRHRDVAAWLDSAGAREW